MGVTSKGAKFRKAPFCLENLYFIYMWFRSQIYFENHAIVIENLGIVLSGFGPVPKKKKKKRKFEKLPFVMKNLQSFYMLLQENELSPPPQQKK